MSKRIKGIGLWFVAAVVALVFIFSGGMKLMGAEPIVQNFIRWGYPLWFMYLVAVVEVVAAVALMVPRLTPFATMSLAPPVSG